MYPSKTDPLFGVFVKNFREELENRGVDFAAVSVIEGKRFHRIQKLFTYLKYYLSIAYNYIFKNYNCVYVHVITHNSPIMAFLLLIFGKKKPLVINVHGDDVISSKGKKIDRLNRFVLKKADLIVVPSSYFKQLVVANYPFLRAKRILVSPSAGVDIEKFYPVPRAENTIPIIGMISRIDAGKGWDIFLDALAVLKNANVGFISKIAGQGLEQQAMQKKIIDLNLTDNVSFLGLIKQDKLVHLYNELDIMVFPTQKSESLGLVGLEAMACKVPVIGSNIAGLKTYISHTVNGFLFSPGDAGALAENIMNFLDLSGVDKDQMRNAAYRTAKDYESKIVMDNLHKNLEKLCTKN